MRRQVWAATRDRVRRTHRDVHDDLDFSMHLGPAEPVTLDRTLRVAISARPFDTPQGLARRVQWAGRTLFTNWPAYSPWHIRLNRRRPAEAQRRRS